MTLDSPTLRVETATLPLLGSVIGLGLESGAGAADRLASSCGTRHAAGPATPRHSASSERGRGALSSHFAAALPGN